jgi:putative membrane protein
MLDNLREFLAHWGVTALALWLTSFIFHGISFNSKKSLFDIGITVRFG